MLVEGAFLDFQTSYSFIAHIFRIDEFGFSLQWAYDGIHTIDSSLHVLLQMLLQFWIEFLDDTEEIVIFGILYLFRYLLHANIV
jgi:hypothetical protein